MVPVYLPLPVASSRGSVRYVNSYRNNIQYVNSYGSNVQYVHGYPYHRRYGRHYGYVHNVYQPQPTAMLGPLPDDFLSVPGAGSCDVVSQRQQQEQTDHAMAAQLQLMNRTQPVVGRLQVTVVRATLHKNYGMTRMDPYARLHFGQQVFETQTDPNGAKNPVWNKTFYIYQLPKSFTSFHMEVYDERTLTDDERVAWVTIPLPPDLANGEVINKTYNLSGRLGDDIEGTINIIMAYETGPAPQPAPMIVYGGYPTATPYASSLPVYQMPQQPPVQARPPPPPPLSEEDVTQVCAMFPDVEAEVVRSVLEASSNNKEAAVEALLAMQPSN